MTWQFDWQNVAALAAISWALWYVRRRLIGVLRRDRTTGCGTCSGCPGKAKHDHASQKTLVPVETLAPRNSRGARS